MNRILIIQVTLFLVVRNSEGKIKRLIPNTSTKNTTETFHINVGGSYGVQQESSTTTTSPTTVKSERIALQPPNGKQSTPSSEFTRISTQASTTALPNHHQQSTTVLPSISLPGERTPVPSRSYQFLEKHVKSSVVNNNSIEEYSPKTKQEDQISLPSYMVHHSHSINGMTGPSAYQVHETAPEAQQEKAYGNKLRYTQHTAHSMPVHQQYISKVRPSLKELHNVVNYFDHGPKTSKLVEVVRVPAVYELHLQSGMHDPPQRYVMLDPWQKRQPERYNHYDHTYFGPPSIGSLMKNLLRQQPQSFDGNMHGFKKMPPSSPSKNFGYMRNNRHHHQARMPKKPVYIESGRSQAIELKPQFEEMKTFEGPVDNDIRIQPQWSYPQHYPQQEQYNGEDETLYRKPQAIHEVPAPVLTKRPSHAEQMIFIQEPHIHATELNPKTIYGRPIKIFDQRPQQQNLHPPQEQVQHPRIIEQMTIIPEMWLGNKFQPATHGPSGPLDDIRLKPIKAYPNRPNFQHHQELQNYAEASSGYPQTKVPDELTRLLSEEQLAQQQFNTQQQLGQQQFNAQQQLAQQQFNTQQALYEQQLSQQQLTQQKLTQHQLTPQQLVQSRQRDELPPQIQELHLPQQNFHAQIEPVYVAQYETERPKIDGLGNYLTPQIENIVVPNYQDPSSLYREISTQVPHMTFSDFPQHHTPQVVEEPQEEHKPNEMIPVIMVKERRPRPHDQNIKHFESMKLNRGKVMQQNRGPPNPRPRSRPIPVSMPVPAQSRQFRSMQPVRRSSFVPMENYVIYITEDSF